MSLKGLLIATTFSYITPLIAPPTKFLMSSCDSTCPFPFPLSSEEEEEEEDVMVLLLGIWGGAVVVAYAVGTTTNKPLTELNATMIASTSFDVSSNWFISVGGGANKVLRVISDYSY